MSVQSILLNQDKYGKTINAIKEDTTEILEVLDESKRAKRYGFRIKKGESDPTARVEYLYDAVGMTPAKMVFNGDNGHFDYGDWEHIWFIRDNYVAWMKPDGTEQCRLNPNNYAQKETDATPVVINTSDTTGNNVMSGIPLCWVKRYEDDVYEYVIICEIQYDESYKAYAHTGADGTIKPFAYHAVFEGSTKDSKLRSLSGAHPESNTNATAEINQAEANGDNWTIRTWSLWQLIGDLCTLISKTTHSQNAFGQGHTTGGSAAEHLMTTGSLNEKGQFFGYSDTTHAVKVFHIENFWGDRWDRLVGLIYDQGTYKVKMTPEGDGYNLTGAGYISIGKGADTNTAGAGSGWQRGEYECEYGRFPIVPITGAENTYETDHFWYNNQIVAVALSGGACADGARCGSRSLDVLAAASGAFWSLGASLVLV